MSQIELGMYRIPQSEYENIRTLLNDKKHVQLIQLWNKYKVSSANLCISCPTGHRRAKEQFILLIEKYDKVNKIIDL